MNETLKKTLLYGIPSLIILGVLAIIFGPRLIGTQPLAIAGYTAVGHPLCFPGSSSELCKTPYYDSNGNFYCPIGEVVDCPITCTTPSSLGYGICYSDWTSGQNTTTRVCTNGYMQCSGNTVQLCVNGQWQNQATCGTTCTNPQYNNAYCTQQEYYCANQPTNTCYSSTVQGSNCYTTQQECNNNLGFCCKQNTGNYTWVTGTFGQNNVNCFVSSGVGDATQCTAYSIEQYKKNHSGGGNNSTCTPITLVPSIAGSKPVTIPNYPCIVSLFFKNLASTLKWVFAIIGALFALAFSLDLLKKPGESIGKGTVWIISLAVAVLVGILVYQLWWVGLIVIVLYIIAKILIGIFIP